jgi:uncharacterized protein YndB with AHSA1/START domain
VVDTVEKSFWIAAAPEGVFDLYANEDAAKSWLGLVLTFERSEGGRYCLDLDLGGIQEGEVVTLQRPSCIEHTVAAPGAESGSRIHLAFEAEGGGTRVTLVHSGLSDPCAAALASRTWDHHLARLAVAATGGNPGPDPLLRDLGVMIG